MLHGLEPPPAGVDADLQGTRERVQSVVSGLLSLLGIDPVMLSADAGHA